MKTKKIILTTIFLVIASLSKNMYSQIDTCYPHQPTIKPLIKTVFGQHEIPVLVAVGPETSYYWDFIWQYSFDGINYLENSKSINGREALVKMSYLPNVQFGQLIYFRIKYCDGVGFGSSPPVTFMFVSEIPEFSSSLYTANVRCPNEAPQPLLLPFSKPLEGNTTITDVYLYQTVVDGRPTDRVDLNFSSNATGLTIFFDKFLSDGDYFLQMEGKSGETSLNTVSTKVRIRNPQALVFEKIVLPSSGTEYHQGVPEIIADGKVTVSVKNYLNDFSVYWNGSGEKSVETIFSNLVSDVYSTKIIYNSNRCDTTFFTTVGLLNRFLNVRIDEGLPILCYEQSDASLQAVFETATTDMEVVFSWKKNGQVLPNETNCFLENLSAGIYTVIAESEGLQSTFSFEVTEPEESGLFHISIVHPYCFGSDDGHIHVGMIGGTPPYRYVWDNGIVSDFIDQLSAGLYRITVYDYNNCTLSHQVKLNDPPQMV
ncbi:MAG: SprB repeat-containing protein, partial [Bacteroidales bacterium]|nr:SprB repeat-containing protein [Bacteroidales bacterium]